MSAPEPPSGGQADTLSVVFATIAAGGGHVATANALAEGLHALRPAGVSTSVSDVMAEFGFGRLDRRHKQSWRGMLKRPRLVRAGQRLTDVAPRLTRAAQNALLQGFAQEAQRRLDELGPDLVVGNHGWLATALTLARTRFGMRSRLLIFATEPFDASALWAEPQAQRVVAPSSAAKEDLVRLGVPAGRVAVLGYPVRQAFLQPPERAAARAELGLDDSFTCLVSLGAEGLAGQAVELATTLARMDHQVVAVAGRNAELEASFRRLTSTFPRLTPVGFTDRMPAYLAAADVVVGKAGPASTMEALAVGRPVIATAYAGLNEERVVRFLQTRGLGGYAPTPAMVKAQVAAWRDEARRAEAAHVAATLDFAGMSRRLSEYLLSLAKGQSPAAPDQALLEARVFEGTTAASLAGPVTSAPVNWRT